MPPSSAASTTRRIIFSQLVLDANIGILDHELRATQPLHVDAELDVIVEGPVNDRDLRSVLDYRELRAAIIQECTDVHVNLLETLIDRVLDRLFKDFPTLYQVKLRLSKPLAFADCAAVGIEMTRQR